MGLLFSIFMKQLNLTASVLLPLRLVWNAVETIIAYITYPWRNLFWLFFNMYMSVWSGIGSFSMKVLVLPIRIYNAIQREDILEEEMQELQRLHAGSEEKLRELECELEEAVDECKQYKELLEEVEAEKTVFVKKYQLLQLRVVELEEENDLLRVHEERFLKGVHEGKGAVMQRNEGNFAIEMHSNGANYVLPPVTSVGGDVAGKLPMHLQLDVNCEGAAYNSKMWQDRASSESRGAALSSSVFSVFMSLLVATIAWQAQDPCIPLVVAVFIVVCMSLKTAVRFLVSICDGPGFDAVVLLSFNWFILGTLAYPVLPKLAQTIAPVGARLGELLLRFTGLGYISEKLRGAVL